jgi:hypothetical protein
MCFREKTALSMLLRQIALISTATVIAYAPVWPRSLLLNWCSTIRPRRSRCSGGLLPATTGLRPLFPEPAGAFGARAPSSTQ